MHQYGMRDVEKLLRLPRSTIRGLIKAGFVSPARGPRKALLFSFQDLIVLRTARALTEANLSSRRITRSLRAAAPPSPRSHAAVRTEHLRGRRSRRSSGRAATAGRPNPGSICWPSTWIWRRRHAASSRNGKGAQNANAAEDWFERVRPWREIDAQAAQDGV